MQMAWLIEQQPANKEPWVHLNMIDAGSGCA